VWLASPASMGGCCERVFVCAKWQGDEADHSSPRCGDYLNMGKALPFYLQDEALYFQV